jgi:hypothetical protein
VYVVGSSLQSPTQPVVTLTQWYSTQSTAHPVILDQVSARVSVIHVPLLHLLVPEPYHHPVSLIYVYMCMCIGCSEVKDPIIDWCYWCTTGFVFLADDQYIYRYHTQCPQF